MADLVLNWGALGAFGTSLEPTQTVDTGGIDVSIGFTPQDPEASAVTFNAPGYVAPGEGFDEQSFLKLDGQGGEGGVDDTSTTVIDFSSTNPLFADEVQDVTFRINDLDGGGDDIDVGSADHEDIVTVRAFDAEGNEVPVTYTTGSEVDANGNTLSADNGNFDYTSAEASTLVSIAGPVARIEIEYQNGAIGEQTVMLSDVCFSTLDNEPGTLGDDAATTDEDTPVIIDVLANDSDPEGDPLTVEETTDPANGSVVINADGTVTYTPDAGFVGTDTFEYTTTDPSGNESTATVTVTVEEDTGPNSPATPVDDAAETDEDTPVVISVLGNDTDPEGDELTVVDTSDPANGSVSINPDGTVTYTPDAGFSGTDTFEYTVEDEGGNFSSALVTVTVGEPNDAPTAVDDADTTEEGEPVVITVLGNDTDPDGDELTVTSVETPNNGTAVINADGTITYTPDAGFTGTELFDYTITDEAGNTSTAEITVVVEEAEPNEPSTPVDDFETTDEDTPVVIDVTANDTDPEGDELTVVDTTEPANGTATINPDGTVTYTPDAGFNGADTFEYTIEDEGGNFTTATVTVQVGEPNEAPTAVDDAETTDEDTPVVITVLGNDTDPEGDDLTVIGTTDPANGSVVINADGTVTYTPDTGFTGTDTFDYTIEDEGGNTTTATVTVTVDDGNEPPVAVDDAETTEEGEPVVITVLGNDSDPEGDELTVISTTVPANGEAFINADGTITYQPNEGFTGTETFDYTIEDEAGNQVTATVTVVVEPNEPPVAVDDAETTEEDTPVVIDVLGNDSDPEGAPLTVIGTTDPADGSVEVNDDGTVTYTPDAGFFGTDTFDYTIRDDFGNETTATVTVVVEEDNEPPVAVDDAETTDEDTPVIITVLGNDSDPEGEDLTVIDATDPANGEAVINADGTITYTPDTGFVGTDTFDYTIEDESGNEVTATVTVVVDEVNDAPEATDDAETTDLNTPVIITVLGNDSDPNGDPLTVDSATDPANGSVTINADGTITYTPDAGFTGTDTFDYTITDDEGLPATATVTVTVDDTRDGIVEGTPGDDLIDVTYTGDPDGDFIDANDQIIPGEDVNDDIVIAGDGDDTVLAGDGNDDVDGGEGNDLIDTSNPDDPALDETTGFPGEPALDDDTTNDLDSVIGGDGDDTILTGDDADTIEGGAGNDSIESGIDDDSVLGGDGDDIIIDVEGDDFIDGGAGDDTIQAGTNLFSDYEGDDPNLPLPGVPGITTDPNPNNGLDTVLGGAGNDVIFTGDDADLIDGGTGNDTIDGGIDDDTIDGGDGDDSILGEHGSDSILGGSGDDVITAGGSTLGGNEPDATDPVPENDRDFVDGGAGNDTITGGDDDDTLIGGTGDDELDGGIDEDSLVGGAGSDTGLGGDGNDIIDLSGPDEEPDATDLLPDNDRDLADGGAGDDSITTGDDDDTILGGAGDDTIDAGIDEDSVDGGAGNDLIDAGAGDDTVDGGSGDDTITGDDGSDVVDGGTGNDVIDTSGTTLELLDDVDPFPGNDLDSVDGGDGDDVITTGDDDDTIDAGAGNDIVDAGIDDDSVIGGAGDDTIDGGQGDDTIDGGDGADSVLGGVGEDVIDTSGSTPLTNDVDPNPTDDADFVDGGAGNDIISTGDDNDTILGGVDNDVIDAGIDDDLVDGGAGNDTIDAGEGDDTVDGGTGDDSIIGGDGCDVVDGGAGADFIDTSGPNPILDATDPNPDDDCDSVLGGAGDDTIITGDDDDTVIGGFGNDVIDTGIDDDLVEGREGDDTIDAGEGNDTVDGGLGNDSLIGGDGDDSIRAASGADTVDAGDGDDTVDAGLGDDSIDAGDGDDSVIAAGGDDTIDGGDGDDVLDGGQGDDVISGGDGADTMLGGGGQDLFDNITAGDDVDGGGGPGGVRPDGTPNDFDTLDLTGAAEAVNPGGSLNVTYTSADREDGFVEFRDADGNITSTMVFEEIENVVPCFTPGTAIATPRGERLVEELKVGDKIITRDNGIQEIRWMGQRNLSGHELARSPNLRPILIQKGALGNNLPEHDILVSPQHRVLINNERTSLYFEDTEVLAAAKHLTDLKGVDEVGTLGVHYVHFMFDNHEVVLSNGAWTESFQPGQSVIDGLGTEQRDEIFQLFPELQTEEGIKDYTAARRALKKHEAKLLVR